MGQDKWTFDDSFFMDYMIRGGDVLLVNGFLNILLHVIVSCILVLPELYVVYSHLVNGVKRDDQIIQQLIKGVGQFK